MARSLGCTRRHKLVRRTAASLPADRWGSETQSTTERPRRERERDTQARSGEAKHACANEESWRPPPSKARHLSFAQSRGQQQLRASLCGTKWVGPRMTWAGEESLPSTSSHRRRLPSLLPPNHATPICTPPPPPPPHSRAPPPLAWRAWHLLASRFSLASIYRSVEAPAWASHLHSLGCPQEETQRQAEVGPSCHCSCFVSHCLAWFPRLCLFWNAAEPSFFARFLNLIDP
jgi:hypothetical protein